LAQDDDPLISIITVNYNGRQFLYNLFNSLLNLNYPKEKIQIIMVDNGSTDGSIDFVGKKFPQVEVISLPENLGYAGGNNEGFKNAEGRYIALVNNDCVVKRDWLREMVNIFKQSSQGSRIGAVSSKVVFLYPYLPLEFIAESATPGELKKGRGSRRLGVNISHVKICQDKIVSSKSSNTGNSKNYGKSNNGNGSKEYYSGGVLYSDVKYLDGFYPPSSDREGNINYWTQDNAILAVPIFDMGKDLYLEFEVSSYISPNSLKIVVGEEIIYDSKVNKSKKKVEVRIPRTFFINKKDIINSCGVKINKYFYSRDRGFLKFDEGQYGRVEEIFAPSGSSLLMEREMLGDVGYFDKSFFTYYEDIDLFWRARLKGWKVFFTPNSIVRHVHCGTSKEWSYSFTYHVLRNRLLAIYKCGWPMLFLKSYCVFVLSSIVNIFIVIGSALAGRKQNRIDIPIRIRIFFELFYLLIKNSGKRFRVRTGGRVSDNDIKSWIRSF
jgi:GT2 family glycosyltransferase